MLVDDMVNRLEEAGLEVFSVTVQKMSCKLDADPTDVYVLKLGGGLRLLYDEACETLLLMSGNEVLKWNDMAAEMALLDDEGRSYRWMPLEVYEISGRILCGVMVTGDFLMSEFEEVLCLIKRMLA